MNVISRVEKIVKRIEPDLGAKYVGPERANGEGKPYIDAADFIFELPDRTRARFCVSGLDCLQRTEDGMLEDLIRAKAKVAMKSSRS
jgi:hypothetical protein